ncbi:MAG: rhodanese-like domain-containing protein [Candidatus Helarchaeota archaeon]|nr:rhodanese-like domain-containing protein [Candidatus Helarchaeota archaeon]
MVDFIKRDELKKKIEKKEPFKLLDVRDTPDFEKEHIVGAVHILISKMNKERLNQLFGKDDLIVTYSLDFNCPASGIAAERLKEFGYTKLLRYKGGWQEWKESGYPTE